MAGGWLAWQGPAALLSRWPPATLVLVHAFALGVLGNAMLGSLLQFLPVAAGSPMPGMRLAPLLHATFNLGVALLLVTLARHAHALAMPAGALLAGTLAAFAVLALAAVVRGHGLRAVRLGIGLALLALLATVALGSALLAARTGWRTPLPHAYADLHAVFGMVGWVVGLLAAVGSVTVPMLQGTHAVPRWWLPLWQAMLLAALSLALALALALWPEAWPAALWRSVALPLVLFATAVAVLQWRSPHRRNPVLRRFWQLGCFALLLAGGIAAAPGTLRPVDPVVAAGVLVIAIGLPMLVLGMMFEIAGFLAWIELRRRVPRGRRVPGVGSLFAEPRKRRLLVAHALAALLLAAAVAHPPLARAAGAGVALAYASSMRALWQTWRDGMRHATAQRPEPA